MVSITIQDINVISPTHPRAKLKTGLSEVKGQKRGAQFGPAQFRQMRLLTFTTMNSTVVISGPTDQVKWVLLIIKAAEKEGICNSSLLGEGECVGAKVRSLLLRARADVLFHLQSPGATKGNLKIGI